MALIKCSECGQEMSDHAKLCPNCGVENNIKFCPECDKKLSSKAKLCPNCGYSFEVNNSNNKGTNEKGENYGMSIAALVCSICGISIVGLILGIIVLNSNKGKQNTAKTMGIVSVIISSVFMVFFLFALITALATFSYYTASI